MIESVKNTIHNNLHALSHAIHNYRVKETYVIQNTKTRSIMHIYNKGTFMDNTDIVDNKRGFFYWTRTYICNPVS